MTCQLGLGSRHSVFTDILLQVGHIYKEGRVTKSVGRYIGRRLFGDFIIALDPSVGSCNVQRYSYHARTQKMRFYPKSVKTMVAVTLCIYICSQVVQQPLTLEKLLWNNF